MLYSKRLWSCALALVVVPAALAQGPGSCGFHLDIVTNDTSTHSAIADVPGAPGAQVGGLPPGSLGNPYTAWATPNTLVRFRVEIPPTTHANLAGTTPVGTGGLVSIFYSGIAGNTLLGPPPGTIPPCSFPSWVISVLPFNGTLVDGLSINGPAPIIPASVPGFPGSFEISGHYPPGLPPLTFQAGVLNPNGQLAVTNGASLIAGPAVWQTNLAFGPSPCGFSNTDEGVATITMPPGFQFYGVPTGQGKVSPNAVVTFGPAAGTTCPFNQGSNGFGCIPNVTEVVPHIACNLADNDLATAPAPGNSNLVGCTVEYALPTVTCPSRTIVRWKHVSPWYSVPGNDILTDDATTTAEFWGSNIPAGSPAVASNMIVVRNDIHVGLLNDVHGDLGITPGYAGQGYNGPPGNCDYVDMWTTWGGWYYLTTVGAYDAAFLNFLPTGSLQIAHMAISFRPAGPGQYRIEAF